MGQNLRLMPADVALDGPVGQQLGHVALGHDQVEKVGAEGAFQPGSPLLQTLCGQTREMASPDGNRHYRFALSPFGSATAT